MTDDEIFQLVKQAGGAWVPRRGFAPHLEMTEDQLFRLVELISKPVECMCGICKLAPRQWQELTDEKADELIRRFERYELLRAIKLKEKNG